MRTSSTIWDAATVASWWRRRGAGPGPTAWDPGRVAEARARVKAAGLESKITVERGDMFEIDLSPATVVTLFVTSDYAERLRPQLAQLKPGAVVASRCRI